MQFKVPQYIDVEDKIFGPFSFRQFAYLVGGGGLVYLLWTLLPFYAGIIPIILIGGLSFGLAFIKINGKPLISIMEAGFFYMVKRKLYLWKKEERVKEVKKEETVKTEKYLPRISESKLHDISWGLDVLTKDSSGDSNK